MKKFLFSIFLLKVSFIFAQTECNLTQVITTNPSAPVNTERPNLINSFDWTAPSFPLRAEQLTSNSITSPFFQGPWNTNVTNLVTSKDRLPLDGWELINADFGYTNTGAPAAQRVTDPKLLLYNKYNSTLRLFFAKGHTSTNDYNFIKIKLSFNTDAGEYSFNTFELQNGGVLFPLDVSNFKSLPVNFQFIQDFQQTPANWVYTDFPMHYDPCTCFFKSKIKIEIRYLTNANVDLTGSFTGKLAAISNGQGSVNNPSDFTAGFKDVTTSGKTVSKAFKSINSFLNDTKKVNTASGVAITNLAGELANSNFLKTGLSAIPYLDAALGFLNFFTGGGKAAGPTQVALTPTSIDLSGKIQGTISNDILNTSGALLTPGSNNIGSADELYPSYNVPMGVITLTKAPKLKWYYSLLSSYSDEVAFLDEYRNDLIFDRSQDPIFEYALNPGSGLRIKEVKAAIVIETNNNGGGFSPGYFSPYGTANFTTTFYKDGRDGLLDSYRTDYFPIDCWGGKDISFVTQQSNEVLYSFDNTRVLLKLQFNLERVSGLGQNVLLVQTYDIGSGVSRPQWYPASNPNSIYNYSITPEPILNTCTTGTAPFTYFKPITSTRLSSICNSTTYKNGHINSRNGNSIDSLRINNLVNESSIAGKIYPNPSSNSINIIVEDFYINRNEVSIMNKMGQKMNNYNIESINNADKTSTIKCDINKLTPGLYVVVLSNKDKANKTFKFIKVNSK